MTDLPNEIYLVPKNKKMVWSEIPSPYPGAKEEDAVKYYHSSVVDELKAQVEQLRKLGLVVVRQCSKSDRYSPEVENLDDALAATPAQCLAEIKAQAVEDAINWLEENHKYNAHPASGLLEHYKSKVLIKINEDL